jgi:hypothetical protein
MTPPPAPTRPAEPALGRHDLTAWCVNRSNQKDTMYRQRAAHAFGTSWHARALSHRTLLRSKSHHLQAEQSRSVTEAMDRSLRPWATRTRGTP